MTTNEILDAPFKAVGLTTRLSNALYNAGCRTLREAAAATPLHLKRTPNLGKSCTRELAEWLDGTRQPKP